LVGSGDSEERHASLGAPDRLGIIQQAGCCQPRLARSLLVCGADPGRAGLGGRTPLQIACALGRPQLARVLLEHGADIQASVQRPGGPAEGVPYGQRPDPRGRAAAAAEGRTSPLQLAVELNSCELLFEALYAGGDPTVATYRWLSAAHSVIGRADLSGASRGDQQQLYDVLLANPPRQAPPARVGYGRNVTQATRRRQYEVEVGLHLHARAIRCRQLLSFSRGALHSARDGPECPFADVPFDILTAIARTVCEGAGTLRLASCAVVARHQLELRRARAARFGTPPPPPALPWQQLGAESGPERARAAGSGWPSPGAEAAPGDLPAVDRALLTEVLPAFSVPCPAGCSAQISAAVRASVEQSRVLSGHRARNGPGAAAAAAVADLGQLLCGVLCVRQVAARAALRGLPPGSAFEDGGLAALVESGAVPNPKQILFSGNDGSQEQPLLRGWGTTGDLYNSLPHGAQVCHTPELYRLLQAAHVDALAAPDAGRLENVQTMMEMDIAKETAEQALQQCGGVLEDAIDRALGQSEAGKLFTVKT
jgi:hypothetical protein